MKFLRDSVPQFLDIIALNFNIPNKKKIHSRAFSDIFLQLFNMMQRFFVGRVTIYK